MKDYLKRFSFIMLVFSGTTLALIIGILLLTKIAAPLLGPLICYILISILFCAVLAMFDL